MRALLAVAGDRPRLEIAELPVPEPGPRQALVRVSAAGLNRVDLLQLLGRYPAPPGAPPAILGIEFAGVVEQLGPNCTKTAVGRRVFGLAGGGAHADCVVSPEELLVEVPDSLSDVEAAATAEAFITAHDALVTQAGLRSGERVLVHAAASGVGLAALQLVAVSACTAFGTVRTPHKNDPVEAIIARMALEPAPCIFNPHAFDDEILARTNGHGVDVILDPVGASYFERNLKSLAALGRMVSIGTMGGAQAALDLGLLLRQRLRLMGTVLRNRTLEEKTAVTRAFVRDVLPLIARRRIGPVIDRTFHFEQAADAYRYMEENRNVGKIVLTLR
jgi:putative PIG3 family NAD(P)H quinone oxidoreductase